MNERILNIKRILDAATGIDNYRIRGVETQSHELFFVHKSLETVRATDTADIKVTVYIAHDGALGDATFTVYASYDEEKIREELEAAKKRAQLVSNEPYELPTAETGHYVSDSNFASFDPPALAAAITEAVYAADCYADGSINALEVFVYRDTVRLINSRGIDKTEVKYRAMVEAIPTWNGEESVELYECHNFTEFSAAAITAEIDGRMQEVRDRLAATAPAQKLRCPVVLTAPELASVIGNIVGELSYARLYNRSNAFSVGDEVQKNPTGDRLSATVCGQMKGSVQASAFDGDGFTLRDREVIADGKVVENFGSVRYASYLGKEPTGDVRCIRAAAGTLTAGELAKTPYLKCVSMSGIQLDVYNNYIGGEVRLAYLVDGERVTPITGISLSGKLDEALSCMRLALETTVYEGYNGPAYAWFDTIEIV